MQKQFRLKSLWLLWAVMTAFALVLSLGTQEGGVRAQVYLTNPHGFFTENSDYCLLCHDIHNAPGDNILAATIESEVCFTCHNGTGSNFNTRLQMNIDPTQNAMHPITVDLSNNPGTYNIVPVTTAGIAPPAPYACSQCHDPHGTSALPAGLIAQYTVDEFVAYPATPDPYALCWQCHDATKIVDDETLFGKHKRHIRDLQSSCTACHYSPHGVPFGKLISFNPNFVTAVAPNENPVYTDLGPNKGSCTLNCHGAQHLDLQY